MCPPVTGYRVPQVVKEDRTARLLRGHIMNADDLKKLTTESPKELAALLKQGRGERLITLLNTMGRFHRHSLHNVIPTSSTPSPGCSISRAPCVDTAWPSLNSAMMTARKRQRIST
jgi:hypothetical protein